MAVWTQAYKDALPSSSFLHMDGKVRMFPVKDDKGNIDMPHLREAIGLIVKSNLPKATKGALLVEARKMLTAMKGQGLKECNIDGLCESNFGEVAPDENVIRDCTLIESGLNKSKTVYYTEDFLQRIAPRSQDGLVYLDHPSPGTIRDRRERSIEGLAGVVTNPHWDAAKSALVGDVTLLDTAGGKHVKGAFASEAVRRAAGLSIYYPLDVMCKETNISGRKVRVPVELSGDLTCGFDIVTIPTAGGRVGKIGG